MRKVASCLVSAVLLALPVAGAQEKEEDRLRDCGTVIREIVGIPDDIPQSLLDKARCVIVFPSLLKAAFLVGGSYGRGAMTCRTGDDFSGPFGAPTLMALEAGSFGFQAGGEATDYVLLVMNDRGARALLESKVKLGGDASVAAGPVGRSAQASTDATMRAEILSYSRARGIFAGVALEGAAIHPDNDANDRIYGKHLSARDIVLHNAAPIPPSAHDLVNTLNSHSPHRA